MRRPIGFWIFSILGIITNLIAGLILIMMFIMPAQAFFWAGFLIISIALLVTFIISFIGLVRLRKWGRNIFLIFTFIMNSCLIILFSNLGFFIWLPFLVFLILFVIYFSFSSVRRLFN